MPDLVLEEDCILIDLEANVETTQERLARKYGRASPPHITRVEPIHTQNNIETEESTVSTVIDEAEMKLETHTTSPTKRTMSEEFYSSDELFLWAMSVPIEKTRIGKYAIHCVLAILVTWCDSNGDVYPGAQTIADRIDGCAKATVQMSLEALEDQGIITRIGKMGRAVKYHLNVDLSH